MIVQAARAACATGEAMRPQLPVRDRNLSLWQSAVRETLLKRGDKPEARQAAEYAVSLHAQAADQEVPLETFVKASVAPADLQKTLDAAQASEHAFNIAEAHRDGDAAAQTTLFDKLKCLIADYSTLECSAGRNACCTTSNITSPRILRRPTATGTRTSRRL